MKKLFVALAALTLFGVSGCSGVGTVQEGNAGLVFNWEGKYVGAVDPGFYLKPFARVDEYTLKEVTISFENQRPKAKDDLSLADLDVDVTYRVTSKEALGRLALKRVGSSVKFDGHEHWTPAYNYVKSVADSEISDAVSQFDSLTIHKSRDALGAAIQKNLQGVMEANDPGDIKIVRVQVRRALPDASIEESIRKVINKEKEHQAAQLEEDIAKALARANAQKTTGLSQQVLQEKYLDALKACAENAGCTLIIDGTSSGKMINVNRS